VMGVDQSRDRHQASTIETALHFRAGAACPEVENPPVLDRHPGVTQLSAALVHSDEHIKMLDESDG